MGTSDTLKAINPGKTYPSQVVITEPNGEITKFLLQSYIYGMYAAIYVNDTLASQTGDSNNRTFISKLKRIVKTALERGATVEFGTVCDVKVML